MKPVWVLVACFLAASLPAQQLPEKNPHTTAEDIERGRKIFEGTCALCHGQRGDGGTGASLASPKLYRAPTDRDLFRIIQRGIPDTEMTRAWQMTDREVWQVAAFVRTLGRVEQQAVRGDAARGAQIYRAKGNCAQCHAAAGQGGRMGPDLSEVGLRRNAGYLRAALTDPEKDLPSNFLQVRVATRDGKKLEGVRLTEDTFAIQIRDYSDRLHSLWKADLADLQRDRGKSPMPSYRGVLTDSEIDDVVAYMASLKGGQ